MKTTFYYRVEDDRYTPEDIIGDKVLAYEVAEEVKWKVEDKEPEEYSYPIHCVMVTCEENIITVKGCVLDADTEMYDEEDWNRFPYYEYEFTFEYDNEQKYLLTF